MHRRHPECSGVLILSMRQTHATSLKLELEEARRILQNFTTLRNISTVSLHTAKSPRTKDCLSYAKPTPLPHARTTSITPSQYTRVAQLRRHFSNPRKMGKETWWHKDCIAIANVKCNAQPTCNDPTCTRNGEEAQLTSTLLLNFLLKFSPSYSHFSQARKRIRITVDSACKCKTNLFHVNCASLPKCVSLRGTLVMHSRFRS